MPDFLGLGNGLLNVVILLAVLVVLVVIHEFGHFIVARRAGVTVHEFGIGFPPRALTFAKDKKGTIYTLNWLPIGGFVRMEGEEGESDDPNAFVHRKLSTRLTILLAGVTMNLLLALVLMIGIAGFARPKCQRAGVVGGGQLAGVNGGADRRPADRHGQGSRWQRRPDLRPQRRSHPGRGRSVLLAPRRTGRRGRHPQLHPRPCRRDDHPDRRSDQRRDRRVDRDYPTRVGDNP